MSIESRRLADGRLAASSRHRSRQAGGCVDRSDRSLPPSETKTVSPKTSAVGSTGRGLTAGLCNGRSVTGDTWPDVRGSGERLEDSSMHGCPPSTLIRRRHSAGRNPWQHGKRLTCRAHSPYDPATSCVLSNGKRLTREIPAMLASLTPSIEGTCSALPCAAHRLSQQLLRRGASSTSTIFRVRADELESNPRVGCP